MDRYCRDCKHSEKIKPAPGARNVTFSRKAKGEAHEREEGVKGECA